MSGPPTPDAEWPRPRTTAIAGALLFAGLTVLWPPFGAATAALAALALAALAAPLRERLLRGSARAKPALALAGTAVAWAGFLLGGIAPLAVRAVALAGTTALLSLVLGGPGSGAP